jgi:hypothetical protein
MLKSLSCKFKHTPRRQAALDGDSAAQRVELDPSWHLKGDLHPDPRAAHVIATAVAAKLRGSLMQETGGR